MPKNQTLQTDMEQRNTFNVPNVPSAAKRNTNPLYIYSVSPERYVRNIGHLGEFLIPACLEGREVSEPLEIPEVVPEYYDNGSETKALQLWDAEVIARDLVGQGGLESHTANNEWRGVFISANKPPKAKEIQAARAKRRQYLEHLVAEADGLELQGEYGRRNINAFHRKAALELNVKRSWHSPAVLADSCPACGSDVKAGIAVCPHCNAILNEAAARKFFPERFKAEETAAANTQPKAK